MRCGAILLAILSVAATDEDLAASLRTLRSVEKEGAGNEEAAAAWKSLVARGPDALLPTLAAFEGASPRAANWLRAAVDALAQRAIDGKQPIDTNKLGAFVHDTQRDGRARRLAYEILARLDPSAPDHFLPGMLDDPAQELRREAIARAMKEAEKTQKEGDKAAAVDALRRIFRSARDRDQVEALAKQLKALGMEVDLKAHYGLIDRWILVASFDNTGMKGYDADYPPEKGLDLKASYVGKGEKACRFLDFTTVDPQGKVDLNAALGKEMGAVAYAYASVDVTSDDAELRLATNNALKVYVDGRLVFFRNEYHHGMKLDQYVVPTPLKKGRRDILLKICQNEQKDDWAQTWSFQARLCDALGGAVPFKIVTEAPPK